MEQVQATEAPQAEKVFHLSLTESQVNHLLSVLSEAPFKFSGVWINGIKETCQSQVGKEPEQKPLIHTV